jgi:hypothetical protein
MNLQQQFGIIDCVGPFFLICIAAHELSNYLSSCPCFNHNAAVLQLELRSYDDDNTKTIMCSSEVEADKDGSEEKKDTKESTPNIETYHDRSHAISDDSEMRGVHAKIDIPIDTICVAIPKKCLITVEMGQATEIGQLILNRI